MASRSEDSCSVAAGEFGRDISNAFCSDMLSSSGQSFEKDLGSSTSFKVCYEGNEDVVSVWSLY